MKIEHITLGGSAVIRDTANILPTTRKHFSPVGWEYKSQVLHLPSLAFGIKISATEEGAMFDITKGGDPVILNVCGFEGCDTLHYVQSFAQRLGAFIPAFRTVIEPVTPNWLYSIVINPAGLTPDNLTLAGEVELYIYEQLFLAWTNK